MGSYVLRRLLLLLPTLFGITFVSFFLIHLAPGDPATAILGVLATPEMIARFREQYHLDQPVPVQYVRWLTALLSGDLGFSIASPIPVVALLGKNVSPTILLTVFAMVIAVPIGVVSAAATALRPSGVADSVSRAAWLIGLSMPPFWLGLMLVLVFAVTLRWFPAAGYVDIFKDPPRALQSLFLPAVTLAIPIAAVISRITRSSILDVSRSDYVRTARSHGIRERLITRRHILRNAAIPTVTTIGLQVGYLLGGAIVVENVFNIPGLGRLLTFAVGNRDYAVIQGIVLVSAIAVVISQLVVDLLTARLDPRIALR